MDDVPNNLYEQVSFWLPLIILALGAIGTFITSIVNSRKTSAEVRAMKQQQTELRDGQDTVLYHLQNDSGNSMKDKVDKIDDVVEAVSKIEAVVEQLHETRSDIRGIRRDVGRLAEVDIIDRQNAAKEHERFYAVIADLQDQLVKHVNAVPDVIKRAQEEAFAELEKRHHEAQ